MHIVNDLALNNEVPQRIHQLNQILLTQKLLAENPLHLSPVVMHEHVSLAEFFTPGKYRRREDWRHPPWRRLKIPFVPIKAFIQR